MVHKRLVRNHKGIEGYFYRSGNYKFTVEPGLIQKASYEHQSRLGTTSLLIEGVKTTGDSFSFYMAHKEDYEPFLADLGVKNAEELVKLAPERRMVLVYDHPNYENTGLSVCGSNQGRGRPRI